MKTEYIFKELRLIHNRLDDIDKKLTQQQEPMQIPESLLLSLPDHLRKTFIVVMKLGTVCATDVSIQTGRMRSVESSYLNQLVFNKLLKKHRESKKVIYEII